MSNAKTAKTVPTEASQEAAQNLVALAAVLPIVSFLIWWLAPVATAGAFDPGWWQSVAITTLLVFVVRPCVTRAKLVVRVKQPPASKVEAIDINVSPSSGEPRISGTTVFIDGAMHL